MRILTFLEQITVIQAENALNSVKTFLLCAENNLLKETTV